MENAAQITGWLAFISLALNFFTCLAMPWSKTKCLWKGKYPGPDECDFEGYRPVARLHQLFVILTILFVFLHLVAVL